MQILLGPAAFFVLLPAGVLLSSADAGDSVPDPGAVPLWLKVAHTLFLCVLVPVYWRQYGPANFLWFSDLALLATLPALWLESRLLASMAAVAVTLLELVWLADFTVRLVAGFHVGGLTRYMFDPNIPWAVRGLSLFHVWLPVLLLWVVWRLGYDRRAWLAQSAVAVVVLPVCYALTDPADNINWVFGLGGKRQTWMPAGVYLVLLIAAFLVGVYLPTHLLLRWAFEPDGGFPS
jgi:hypothetical protein